MSLLTLPRLRRRRPQAVPETHATSRTRPRRRRRRWGSVAVVLVTLLALVRFVGSPIAKRAVNRELMEMDGFVGRVDAVTLALWRGAIDVENFVLYERGYENDRPVVHVRHASMRLAPGALFSGKLGGAGLVDHAEVNIVKRHDIPDADEKAEAGLEEAKRKTQRWQDVFRETFPLELTRLEVTDTRVRFIDRSTQPEAEIGVENLRIVATNLQNRPEAKGDPMPAKVRIDAITTGGGKLHAEVQANPIAEEPTFAVSFELREVKLPEANDFLSAFANADVSRGTFEFFTEVKAEGGSYDGYVKPLFHDLEFESADDGEENFVDRAKEAVVSAVASVLENDEADQVATRAPFSGNFTDNEVDVWSALGNLLRNAFVQALRSGFEGGGATD